MRPAGTARTLSAMEALLHVRDRETRFDADLGRRDHDRRSVEARPNREPDPGGLSGILHRSRSLDRTQAVGACSLAKTRATR